MCVNFSVDENYVHEEVEEEYVEVDEVGEGMVKAPTGRQAK
jgi:hypothetical protein